MSLLLAPPASSVRWTRLSIAAGLLVLAALWLGPLVRQSHTAFSAHMLLHLGVMLVAAPLLAWAIAARLPSPAAMGEAAQWYLLAAAFETLAVWGWHIPALHDAASRAPLVFALEQVTFLLAGLALWVALLSARTAASAIVAALVAALTFSHMSMFGLLLALVPHLIYDPSFCRGWMGLDGLDDQHLGGGLMAAGGLVYLATALVLVARAVRASRA